MEEIGEGVVATDEVRGGECRQVRGEKYAEFHLIFNSKINKK